MYTLSLYSFQYVYVFVCYECMFQCCVVDRVHFVRYDRFDIVFYYKCDHIVSNSAADFVIGWHSAIDVILELKDHCGGEGSTLH